MPEALVAALDELEAEYGKAKHDPEFAAEVTEVRPRPGCLLQGMRAPDVGRSGRVACARNGLHRSPAARIGHCRTARSEGWAPAATRSATACRGFPPVTRLSPTRTAW